MTSITTATLAGSVAPATSSPPVNMETLANLAISGDALQSAMGATLDDMLGGGLGAKANATSMVKLHLQTAQLELSTSLLGSVTSATKNQIEKIANGM